VVEQTQTQAGERLDTLFFALSDGTRRAMLGLLAAGERSVSELAAPFPMSLAAVSKHLQVLERGGLVTRRWSGRVAHCRLRGDALATASAWLEQQRLQWQHRLDALEAMLEEERQAARPARPAVRTGRPARRRGRSRSA
jgi:DNA-binding transcriptional ArsR family regulator